MDFIENRHHGETTWWVYEGNLLRPYRIEENYSVTRFLFNAQGEVFALQPLAVASSLAQAKKIVERYVNLDEARFLMFCVLSRTHDRESRAWLQRALELVSSESKLVKEKV